MALAGDDRPDYERSDVSLRLIAAIGGAVALLLVASPLVLRSIYDQPSVDLPTPLPPAPRLQRDPAADWRAYRAAQTQRLNAERWVDRERGVAHIPIDAAMRLLAEQGRSGWPASDRTP